MLNTARASTERFGALQLYFAPFAFADIFMDHVDTLIAARWIIPIEPSGRVLDDHCVAIHDGRIVAIVPRSKLRSSVFRPRTHRAPFARPAARIRQHPHACRDEPAARRSGERIVRSLAEREIWPLEQPLAGCGVRARRHGAGHRRHAHERYDLLSRHASVSRSRPRKQLSAAKHPRLYRPAGSGRSPESGRSRPMAISKRDCACTMSIATIP